MADNDKREAVEVIFENVRVINAHLAEMDAFKDQKTGREADPKYKIEFVVPWDDVFEKGGAIDLLCDEMDADFEGIKWDDDDILDTRGVVLPFLDGDKLALKRERRGKQGDAYRGFCVVRADTVFNADGVRGPGGIQVYDEDVKRVPQMDIRKKIYNGCYATVKTTISTYTSNDDDPAGKFYLQAVQFVGDGEPLASAADHSDAFKKVGKKAGGRSRRKG